MANDRLVGLADGFVCFRWHDYAHGYRLKAPALPAAECLARLLLHVVPDGFVGIRPFGLLANRARRAKLARCRDLPAAAPPAPPPAPEPVAALLLRLTGVGITAVRRAPRGAATSSGAGCPGRSPWRGGTRHEVPAGVARSRAGPVPRPAEGELGGPRCIVGRGDSAFGTGLVISNLLQEHPDLGYEQALRYPAVRVDEAASSDLLTTRAVALDHLSPAYLRFRPPRRPRTLYLASGIEGLRGADAPARIAGLARVPDAAATRHAVPSHRRGAGLFGGVEIPGFGRADAATEIVAAIANTTWGTRVKEGFAVTSAANLT